jgi:hypothetical protein
MDDRVSISGRGKDLFLGHRVHTGSGDHSVSYPMRNDGFSHGKQSGQGMKSIRRQLDMRLGRGRSHYVQFDFAIYWFRNITFLTSLKDKQSWNKVQFAMNANEFN